MCRSWEEDDFPSVKESNLGHTVYLESYENSLCINI